MFTTLIKPTIGNEFAINDIELSKPIRINNVSKTINNVNTLIEALEDLPEYWTLDHDITVSTFNIKPNVINSFDDLLINKLVRIEKLNEVNVEYNPLTISKVRIEKWGNNSTVYVNNALVLASNVYILAYRFYIPLLKKHYDTKESVLKDIDLIKQHITIKDTKKQLDFIKDFSKLNSNSVDKKLLIQSNDVSELDKLLNVPSYLTSIGNVSRLDKINVCPHTLADIEHLQLIGAVILPDLDCKLCNEPSIICRHNIDEPEVYQKQQVSNGVVETSCRFCGLIISVENADTDYIDERYVLNEDDLTTFVKRRITVIMTSLSENVIALGKKTSITEVTNILESRLTQLAVAKISKIDLNNTFATDNIRRLIMLIIVISGLLKLHYIKPKNIIVNPKIKKIKGEGNLLTMLVKGHIHTTVFTIPIAISNYLNKHKEEIDNIYEEVSIMLPDAEFSEYIEINNDINLLVNHPYFMYVCKQNNLTKEEVMSNIYTNKVDINVYFDMIEEIQKKLFNKYNPKEYENNATPITNALVVNHKSNELLHTKEFITPTDTITYAELLESAPVFPSKVKEVPTIKSGSVEWTVFLHKLSKASDGIILPLMYDIRPFIEKCIVQTNGNPSIAKLFNIQGFPTSIKTWYNNLLVDKTTSKTISSVSQFNVEYESSESENDDELFDDDNSDKESEKEVDE